MHASSISEKTGEPLIKTIYQDEHVIGYAFETDDVALEEFLIRQAPPVIEEEKALWEQVWEDKSAATKLLVFSMLLLTLILLIQDW